MKYLTLNTDGLVINVIIWDGLTPYNPGQSDTLIALTDAPQGAWTGWTYISGVWTPPPAPPEPEISEQE